MLKKLYQQYHRILHNIQIPTKLFLSFAMLCSLLAITGAIGVYGMIAIQQNTSQIVNTQVAKTQAISATHEALDRTGSNLNQLALNLFTWKAMENYKNINNNLKNFTTQINIYLHYEHTAGETDMVDRLKNVLPAYQKDLSTLLESIPKATPDMIISLRSMIQHSNTAYSGQMDEYLGVLTAINQQQMQAAQMDIQNMFYRSLWQISAITLLAILIAIVLAQILTIQLANPLHDIEKVVAIIASGKLPSLKALQQRYDGKDAISNVIKSLENMAANLRSLIGKSKTACGNVNNATQSITTYSHELSQASLQVAEAIHYVAIGTQKQMLNLNKSSKDIDELTKKSLTIHTYLQNHVEQQTSMKIQFEEVSHAIHTLESNSVEIGSITQTIMEVAEQTNLLALNAAIEAARAGEQGRGFAVVADEVRKLAEKVASATSDIHRLLIRTQQDTTTAVGSVNEGMAKIDRSVTEATLISENAKKVAEEMSILDTTIEQIAQISENTGSAAEEVSATTEEFSAHASDAAKVAQELYQTEKELEDCLSIFQIYDEESVDTNNKLTPEYVLLKSA
jgi:methyl-accepting chemotaxis protein